MADTDKRRESADNPLIMEEQFDEMTPTEIMARRLAAMAGVDWEKLLPYPGFGRNQWIHEASKLIEVPGFGTRL